MPTINDYRKQVTEELIELIKAGTAPWQMPWDTTVGNTLPRNIVTNKRYRGGNVFHLLYTAKRKGYKDPRWLTYKQAKDLGYQVRKGERGTHVEFWKPVVYEDTTITPIGELEITARKGFLAKTYTVFNGEQIEGLPAYQIEEKPELKWQPCERAERILKASEVKIFNDNDDVRAYYSPSKDEVHLPVKEAFEKESYYYGTALHELAHATGHETRLNRTMAAFFGTAEYAKEELRAEIAAMMMGKELNLAYQENNHEAYVESWLEVLKNDYNEIFKASSDSEKICDWMYEKEKEYCKANGIVLEEEKTVDKPETVKLTREEQLKQYEEKKIKKEKAIKAFVVPNRKLTIYEKYKAAAQKQYLEKGKLNDKEIAKKLLLEGNAKIAVIKAIGFYSPETTYGKAQTLVNKVAELKSIQKVMCSSRG